MNKLHGIIDSSADRIISLHYRGQGSESQSTAIRTLPCLEDLIRAIEWVQILFYPGYFCTPMMEDLRQGSQKILLDIHATISTQIQLASEVMGHSHTESTALDFIHQLPHIYETLQTDLKAAYEGDPAASSYAEVVLAYPGFFATFIYRLAHLLQTLEVPLLPRMMTEYAHRQTGIDIHPAAKIGSHFFIDHGTGVVIGETTTIGQGVKLYQGVTLGALSFPKDAAGKIIKHQKRHPTLEDNVVVYAGATILGGQTVIGHGSVIGGNTWITASVPPNTKIILERTPT